MHFVNTDHLSLPGFPICSFLDGMMLACGRLWVGPSCTRWSGRGGGCADGVLSAILVVSVSADAWVLLVVGGANRDVRTFGALYEMVMVYTC